MTTYISILRGINVGGKKLIKMDALRTMLESLNFKNIRTYVQSGNVIFTIENTDVKELAVKISNLIEKEFQFVVIYFASNAVYLYLPNGYSETKLNNNFLEKKLKVVATTRNWKTTKELLKIATQ